MIGKAKSRKKVFVGLSGGVDSAVSAALLKRAGYDVTGVFIKVWQPEWIECNWQEDRRDAMRVAAKLDIPFVTLDLEEEYKKNVIDYMISEYRQGRTPNPDVMCNKTIKFGAFYEWAMENGADFVATGHYARIECIVIPAKAGIQDRDNRVRYSLCAGKDETKDQSYFLWNIKQEQLPHILFPIGHIKKPEVRKLADRFGLPNAKRKDSQGLCFIGKVDIKEFLSHYLKSTSGKVLDENGEVIGSHPGAIFFTIGERHGFVTTKRTSSDTPLYVIDKDIDQNTITVGPRSQRHISETIGNDHHADEKVYINNVNWVCGHMPEDFSNIGTLTARTRYRQPLQAIKISAITLTEVIIQFKEKQDAITPGQSLVIYDGDKCLGGGVIM